MRFDLEYGFNNESLPKFEEYEIKVINNIKYVVPKIDNTINMSNYTVISFDDYEEKKEEEVNPIIKELSLLDVDSLSPIQALNYLYELKKKISN